MDGDSRSFFVSSNLFSPTGLTVDYQGECYPLDMKILTNYCDFKPKPNSTASFKSCPDVKYHPFYISGDKLYWSDSYMNTINYIGLDGTNRGELTHDPRADIMHIAIFGSHLYYTAVNRQ